jgi:Tfp pilus assembly protein PilF
MAGGSWCLLLGGSITFDVLAGVVAHAGHDYLAGNFYLNQNRPDEARDYFQKAVALEPDSATLHYALANALSRAGHLDESVIEYRKALAINPNDAQANNNLGYTLIQLGRAGEAITYFGQAVEIKPSYQAYFNLAYADRRNGMAANAITNYQKALELQPQFVPAWKEMAWIRATWPEASVRDGSEAVAFAEKANDLTGGADPQILRTLAAAYAETGKFPEAEATAKKALALAAAQSKTVLESELQTEMGGYEAKVPCRSTNN